MKKRPPLTDYRIRFGTARSGARFQRVFPFKRNWVVFAVIAIMDIIFTIPAITTFQEAAHTWGNIDNLFNLVIAIFLSGWLLGWSIAPLALTTILLALLFGREVVSGEAGKLKIAIGLPGIAFEMKYTADLIRNLRHAVPEQQSGTSWRGPHMVFDYGSHEVAFGSEIDERQTGDIQSFIEMATGNKIREGEARPETLAEEARLAAAAREAEQQSRPEPSLQSSSTTDASPITLASPSSLALIIANLIPVAGTLFLDWRLSDVMVIYWAESAIIGFFNLLKMAVISGWMALLAGAFFIGHFGAFMAVHFLFIYGFFLQGFHSMDSGGDLLEVAQLFIDLWPALVALFISHGYSFWFNFVVRKEYLGRTLKDQMGEPYNRIVFMHLIIIFGGGITMFLGEPTLVILAMIVIKIYLDLRAHIKQRGVSSDYESADMAD